MPTQLSALGLFTSVNEAEAPEGSLIRAENCVIRNKDTIEPRRGFKAYDYGFGTSGSRTKQGFFYQDKAHVQYGTTLAYDTGSAFVDYAGSFTGADETLMRMKYQAFRDNLYLATTTGIRKIPDVGNAPRDAGVPQSLGYASHFTGNLASGNQILRFSSNGIVSVTNSSFAPYFSAGETVFCTSTDANFPGGSKVITQATSSGFQYLEATGVSATGTGTIHYQSQPLVDSSGFLADGYQCAYRFVLDIPDNNHQILLGPPSDRVVIENKSGVVGYSSGQSKNVQIRISLPTGLPQGTRIWVYRTEQTTISPNVPPSEEMYKVYERLLAPSEISKRLIVIKDIVPDLLLEDLLYTSPVAEGIINANFKPPQAKDVASWNNRLWFANTKTDFELTIRFITYPRFYFQIKQGSTIETYVGSFGVSGALTNISYLIYAGGSASQNTEITTQNLVSTINKYSTLVEAFYESSLDDPPGIMRLRSISGATFQMCYNFPYSATLTERQIIDPILPYAVEGNPSPTQFIASLSRSNNVVTVTPTSVSNNVLLAGEQISIPSGVAGFPEGTYTITGATSTTFTYADTGSSATATNVIITYAGPFTDGYSKQETVVNRVYFSKLQQGEAVPLLNYMDVGSPGKQILRICPLRERLYVFKEDGIYTIAGEYPYRVDLVDDTSWLIAADTVALTGNQIFCLTNQGVVSVSEPGVSIVSRPIETDIFGAVQFARNANNLKSFFGTGYNSDRTYMLGVAESTEWFTQRTYVYNYLNKVWTIWSKNHSWGAVHPTQDKLYYGNTRADNLLTLERKTSEMDAVDYADEVYATTINSVNETAKTMVVASAANIGVGDMLYCGPSVDPSPQTTINFTMALVRAVNGTTITFEYVYSPATWPYSLTFTDFIGISNKLRIYKKYNVILQYATITGGDVTLLKQFQEVSLIFGNRSFANLTIAFASNALPSSVAPTGLFAEPLFSDGRYHKLSMERIIPTSKRLVVPRPQQQATNLSMEITFAEAMAYFRLLGFSYEANAVSKLANRTR